MKMAFVAFTLIAAGAVASAQRLERPDVAKDIAAPTDEEVVLIAHAKGRQIYKCEGDQNMSLGWILQEPKADLYDDHGKKIGEHFKGPTWKLNDGSSVTGKMKNEDPSPDEGSVPWLLVNAVGHAGKGKLDKVMTIQRVNTKGGQPPMSGCDPARDKMIEQPYSADYVFYALKPEATH